jgi:hypothetical protein
VFEVVEDVVEVVNVVDVVVPFLKQSI